MDLLNEVKEGALLKFFARKAALFKFTQIIPHQRSVIRESKKVLINPK